MNSPPASMYLLALGVTLATEWPIVWLGVRRPNATLGNGMLWALAVFVGVHLFSHGTLWWSWHSIPGAYETRLLIGESAVVIIEAAGYHLLVAGVSWLRALLVSLSANLVSTAIGLGLWWVLLA